MSEHKATRGIRHMVEQLAIELPRGEPFRLGAGSTDREFIEAMQKRPPGPKCYSAKEAEQICAIWDKHRGSK